MPQSLADVEICSLALKLIGSKPIQTFADQTPQASLMALLYPIVRDTLLRSFHWKFAIKRVVLNQLTLTVPQFLQLRIDLPTGKYVYALPTDFLSITETDQDPSPYKIESAVVNTTTGAQQLVLLSDVNVLKIRYVSRITDTTLFDPSFAWALVASLMMEAALPESGDLKKQEMASKMYAAKIQEARLLGSFEDSQDTLIATTFTTDTR